MGVCAWQVFTAADLFALASPPQHHARGLHDLLTADAGAHALEYNMSNEEKGRRE